jgi:hypothetical protein
MRIRWATLKVAKKAKDMKGFTVEDFASTHVTENTARSTPSC